MISRSCCAQLQMKRATIWSTAVATAAAAAAATTTTVLLCSSSPRDSTSRQQQRYQSRTIAFASAFSMNAPWNSSKSWSASFPTVSQQQQQQKQRLSFFSTALNTAVSSLSANTTTHCEEGEGGLENESVRVTEIPFDDSTLSYDHYNGVTIDLEKYDEKQNADETTRKNNDSATPTSSSTTTSTTSTTTTTTTTTTAFAKKLNDALTIWRAEGRKGIWIHANTATAKYIPSCIDAGFQFHKILAKKKKKTTNDESETSAAENNNGSSSSSSSSENSLVMSQWLPTDTASRLPHGPTHQVGVGVILLNPLDPSQMLVVQELTGPASKYNLWKMPTGLVDPGEYVPEAARRELLEETGIEATMSSILCIRQAHRSNADTSDMFFVCKMTPCSSDGIQWKRQEAEIADIRWMSVKDYCDQGRWQGSPLYETLNDCVLRASKQESERLEQNKLQGSSSTSTSSSTRTADTEILGMEHQQLEVGFGRSDGKSEALFLPPQYHSSLPASTNSKL